MSKWCNYYNCSCSDVKEIAEVVECHTDCEVCIFEGGENMKNGKRLTMEQKVLLKSMGLDPKDYLCTKKTSDNFQFVHRDTEKILDVRR